MQMYIRKEEKKIGTKKSQLSFINISACNAHHYFEPTTGNIDINALNDDKYFPVVLFFSVSFALSLSLHIAIKLTKNNLYSLSLCLPHHKKMLIFCCLASTFTDLIEEGLKPTLIGMDAR
jgi:hypothetical protein